MSASPPASQRTPPRIAVLCGKAGGDLKALLAARAAGLIDFEVVSCIATRADSAALQALKAEGQGSFEPLVISFKEDRSQAFAQVAADWDRSKPDRIFLCGFPYLLPATLVGAYRSKIINSHHSLLPAHPGLFLKEELAASGDKFLGATVHLVDEGMDTGPVLAQAVFPNYGMVAFDRVLSMYRFVQDLLIVQTFRELTGSGSALPTRIVGDVMLNPGVDEDVLNFFISRHGLS